MLYEVETPPVLVYISIDIYISLGFHRYRYLYFLWDLPMRSLVFLRFFILKIFSFLLFEKGCVRMSSVHEICW